MTTRSTSRDRAEAQNAKAADVVISPSRRDHGIIDSFWNNPPKSYLRLKPAKAGKSREFPGRDRKTVSIQLVTGRKASAEKEKR